ncbi:aminotransferase class III-fold pyridoxal phosphate-dependent enzyme [candidate division KSB3 bacterium]|uniref:Aminotransferase class III-fold pyridoxal phosphate-dependent enzyme n=1 Tax=candidate division KSB3 bacterium TaxID=2044937 RepID=A0A9D5Q792_9BACT|nr:aminotransferase class III-fold pyridoxal phosphate-dependent enzyme [candidate division KSB3 bacterium]MBD3326203.1 aminotransferase class III-fold pyridoxal phosphate-dependent enzyme [candidate division KSB3 bacterium]
MSEKARNSAQRQRDQFKVTEATLKERVEASPFGEKTKALARKWAEYESFGSVGWGIFSVTPIIERGEGAYLYDVDGKRYFDLLAGFSVSSLGECNQEITKIIQQQAGTLTHYFDFPHVERVKLAEKLCKNSKITDKTRVVFGVTGSDGIELAVRAARYATGQPYILTAYGDYHGVTYGTMGLTGKGNMQPYFYPILPDKAVGYFHFPYCYRCPYDKEYPACDMFCMKSFEKLLDSKESPYTDGTFGINNVAAILVEPFQSSAGYYIPPEGYLQELRRITNKFGMLLIIDEIQAGLGRSGKLWAFEHSGIEPDMFTTSKALGGGLPLAAVVAKSEILTEWGPGAHVSTQAGNVLACAAGNYVLDVVSSEDFLKNVNDTGAYFMDGLRELEKKHPLIGHIDNRGIYTGVELVKDRKTKEPAIEASTFIRDRAVEEGLLYEKGGYYHNRMQLIPPLNIARSELDDVIGVFDKIFGEAEKKYDIG